MSEEARLRLLGDVSWQGSPIPGGRSAALLASLALHPAGLTDAALVSEIWDEDAPAAPTKALQVLVSRLRALSDGELVERHGGGYRLATADVDAWRLPQLAEESRAALATDPETALTLGLRATALHAEVVPSPGEDPLARLRHLADQLGHGIRRTTGLALSRTGRDAEATTVLAEVHAEDPDDTDALVALLRSESASLGAPVALARYDAYRLDLVERLGVDPDPALQALHRELLVSDAPVRVGVQYDADSLLGRDDDLARLRALVRTGRLTTIVGPGGLGKTRVAHVLAREALQPRVYFVELVGVDASDVLSEVAAVVGVRRSVAAPRTRPLAQDADTRGRLAQELDTVPTLLVLDNCEHVLDAVAALVSFLLATTGELHVVTTSRAALGIAAERVLPLTQLSLTDGVELFRRRAWAARPTAELPEDVVTDIVGRLDGLPLAVELAAARVRAMSVEEVRRRLEDRFALLRGHDRSLPARHQTLIAVIDWSWNLLDGDVQRALTRLSLFADGFTGGAASALLGPRAVDLVEALVDQSLLTVVEEPADSSRGGSELRYRMLETVREFGLHRLGEWGELEAARADHAAWAVALANELGQETFGPRQVEAIDRLAQEENNLTDVLRRLLLADDAADAVPLIAALGALWSVAGNHARVFAIADLAEQVLVDWEPPEELLPATTEALSLLMVHQGFLRSGASEDLRAALARLDPPEQPWARAVYAVFIESPDVDGGRAASLALTTGADPATALMGWQWAAVIAENQGDVDAAEEYVDEALARLDATTTTWQVGMLHAQKAELSLQHGRHREAVQHARIAAPLMDRLHAHDDADHMRMTIALGAILDRDLVEAERLLTERDRASGSDMVGGGMLVFAIRAELALARGDVEAGLATYHAALAEMRDVRFPGVDRTGLEPWVLVALAADLAAHTRHGTEPARARLSDELAAQSRSALTEWLAPGPGTVDYPVAGMLLFALGGHLLARGAAADDPLRLLALAQRYSYNSSFPVMAWEPFASLAETRAPGRLPSLLDEYGDRTGRELRPEAVAVLARLDVLDVLTSAG